MNKIIIFILLFIFYSLLLTIILYFFFIGIDIIKYLINIKVYDILNITIVIIIINNINDKNINIIETINVVYINEDNINKINNKNYLKKLKNGDLIELTKICQYRTLEIYQVFIFNNKYFFYKISNFDEWGAPMPIECSFNLPKGFYDRAPFYNAYWHGDEATYLYIKVDTFLKKFKYVDNKIENNFIKIRIDKIDNIIDKGFIYKNHVKDVIWIDLYKKTINQKQKIYYTFNELKMYIKNYLPKYNDYFLTINQENHCIELFHLCKYQNGKVIFLNDNYIKKEIKPNLIVKS